jgi:hypothetical protein
MVGKIRKKKPKPMAEQLVLLLIEPTKWDYSYALGSHGNTPTEENYWSLRSLKFKGNITRPEGYPLKSARVDVFEDSDLAERERPMEAAGYLSTASSIPNFVVSIEPAAFGELVSVASAGAIKAIEVCIGPIRYKKAIIKMVSFSTGIAEDNW